MTVELRDLTDDVLADLRQHVVLPPEQAEWVGGTINELLEEAADQPDLIGSWSLWKLPVAPSAQGSGASCPPVSTPRPTRT